MTLSFWIKSSVAQTFKGFLRTRDGTEQRYTFDIGSLSADTWTKITKTIPGNSNITINNDNGEGLQINIGAFWGGTFTDNSVTEDAWGAYSGSTRMKDNTSTWYTTNNATLEVTGVQLEVGSTTTDFEHRSFGEELSLCQRYFFRYKNDAGDHGHFVNATSYGSTDMRAGAFNFPTTMRSSPSFSHSGTGNFALLGLGSSISNILIADVGTSVSGCGLRVQTGDTLTNGLSTNLRANNTANAHFDFDSEL